MAGTDGTVDDGASGTTPVPRRARDVVYDALAVVGVLVVLVFPFAAEASVPAAADPGTPAGTSPLPPLPAHARRGGPLRDLPVFTPGGPVDAAVRTGRLTDRATLDALVADRARAAFGPAGDLGLLRLARDCGPLCGGAVAATGAAGDRAAAPLRFPGVDAIVDRALDTGRDDPGRTVAAGDLAGLLLLDDRNTSAAPIAYSLYDRARRSGDCGPALDFALLNSTWGTGTPDPRGYATTVTLYRDAIDACRRTRPDDPTADWMLGQFQSVAQRVGPAVATFRRIQRRFPGSVLGWSGEADALVREGYRLDLPAPFTARADFRRAAALYARARALGRSRPRRDATPEDRDPGLLAGEARARAGAGDYDGAAVREAALVRGLRPAVVAPFLRRRARDLERAARFTTDPARRPALFAEAARAGARAANAETVAAAGTVEPLAAGRFAFGSYDPHDPGSSDRIREESARQPISVGATRFRPVAMLPPPAGSATTLPLTDAVEDLSFIPAVRQEGSVSTNGPCGDDPHRDRYLAHRLSGPVVASPDCTIAADRDDEQNLWRFAGDLERAATVAAAWVLASPDDPVAADRAGEIAFLRHRYAAAAAHFAAAAAHTAATGFGDEPRLRDRLKERLKEGTALELAGRLRRAGRVLSAVDRRIGSLLPAGSAEPPSDADAQLVLDDYHAQLQLGDAALRSHRPEMGAAERRDTFEAAVAHYEAARARGRQLEAHEAELDPVQRAVGREEPLLRPEALDNNEAIALVQLGRHDDARRVIRAAVATDPANPVFLGNLGYVEEQAGHDDAAVAAYRAAVTADPSAAQAANNLGVLLAGRGQLHAATDAFRRAVAARETPISEGYPTAEFNLGVALARLGPGHALESQGHLAAAIREDPELREHDRTFITDDETVFTTLDLSKPLPPRWSLAESEERAPFTVGGVAVAILLVALVQQLAKEHVADDVKENTLEAGGRLLTRASRVGERIPGAAALVAVVAVFAYPLVGSPGTTATDYLLLGAGVAALVFASMRLRLALARRHGITARHHPHVPVLLLAGAGTALGVPVAPMPAPGDHAVIPQRARWTAIGALGLITAAMLLIGHVTRVPIATALGTAGLVMTASALLPVKPFDGAYLERWHFGLVAALTLGTVAFLVEQGMI